MLPATYSCSLGAPFGTSWYSLGAPSEAAVLAVPTVSGCLKSSAFDYIFLQQGSHRPPILTGARPSAPYRSLLRCAIVLRGPSVPRQMSTPKGIVR